MFTKQVSGLVDGLDPHHGRRGAAGRANSKKDLLTGLIRVSVPFTIDGGLFASDWEAVAGLPIAMFPGTAPGAHGSGRLTGASDSSITSPSLWPFHRSPSGCVSVSHIQSGQPRNPRVQDSACQS